MSGSNPWGGADHRSLRLCSDGWSVEIIDQRCLPHELVLVRLDTLQAAATAIADMQVRGAPLIGVTAAYGLALAVRADASDGALHSAAELLIAQRPTAVNLRWAVERMVARLQPLPPGQRCDAAYQEAAALLQEDIATCAAIGEQGLTLLRKLADAKAGGPLKILTHCNAGALACVAWGTATAPLYKAQAAGMALHVWVDETRPRLQGAALTAWELAAAGVPHTLIVDNAGGHLMQAGAVDICLVGTDRVAANGDVGNKIGTYLKALAARDNGVPFYVAAPSSSIDWSLPHGSAMVIEERAGEEVTHVAGVDEQGAHHRVRIAPAGSAVANPGFDVTPGRLVTGLITERGICPATARGLAGLFPERTERHGG